LIVAGLLGQHIAGTAAAVATSGLIRRALGCLLGFAGAAVAVFAVGDLLVPAAPGATGAPLLAVAGGVALVAVGVFVLSGRRDKP